MILSKGYNCLAIPAVGAPLLNVTGPAYASYYLFSHQTEIEANPSASKYSTRIV